MPAAWHDARASSRGRVARRFEKVDCSVLRRAFVLSCCRQPQPAPQSDKTSDVEPRCACTNGSGGDQHGRRYAPVPDAHHRVPVLRAPLLRSPAELRRTRSALGCRGEHEHLRGLRPAALSGPGDGSGAAAPRLEPGAAAGPEPAACARLSTLALPGPALRARGSAGALPLHAGDARRPGAARGRDAVAEPGIRIAQLPGVPGARAHLHPLCRLLADVHAECVPVTAHVPARAGSQGSPVFTPEAVPRDSGRGGGCGHARIRERAPCKLLRKSRIVVPGVPVGVRPVSRGLPLDVRLRHPEPRGHRGHDAAKGSAQGQPTRLRNQASATTLPLFAVYLDFANTRCLPFFCCIMI